MKTMITFGLIVLLFSSVGAAAQNEGSAAPDFTLNQLGGGEFKLSDFAGKVVFIFWLGYDCPFCRSAAPSINSEIVSQFNSNNDFVAIGIDTWDGSSTAVNSFKSSTGLNVNYLLKGSSVAKTYNTTYDRLAVIDTKGILVHKGSIEASSDVTNAKVAVQAALDVTTSVSSLAENVGVFENYPNPFRDETTIRFQLNKSGMVSMDVYTITGKKVLSLVEQTYPSGEHQVNISKGNLEKGLYLLRMKNESISLTHKMIIQ
jgi:peroxiredoxin